MITEWVNEQTMNGKLVETSMDCVGVSKETVVNLEVSWYTVWLRIRYWRFRC